IGVHYDITDRKKLSRELEIAKEKAVKAQMAEKQFLANMSHEIRTPLNAIIGMSHLLGDTKLGSDQKEYLDILTSSTTILKNLISDILDISKIDAGTIEVNEESFDIDKLSELLINTITSKNSDKEIAFNSIVDKSITNYIVTDKQLLNQILLNLLSNAEKFTNSGKVELRISLLNQEPTFYNLQFEVIDTGIGMTKDELKGIFSQFKQANSGVRQKYGGTGLGLTISKSLVKLLGGELQVKSEKDIGTKFYFDLKLKKGLKLNKKENAILEQVQRSFKGKNKRVLVAEDNRMNLKYISTLFQKWNLDYDVASNGLEAVKLFKKSKYDIIFMDLSMPIMDGYEACVKIREMEEVDNKTPIIALTASTFLSKKQLALKAGMSDFVSKPFTPDQLFSVIEKYINPSNVAIKLGNTFDFNENLDIEYLKNSYGGDIAYACEMFKTFDSIIEDELILIESSFEENDNDKVKQLLHKIKPTFTMVGLSGISKNVEDLEKILEVEDLIHCFRSFINVKTDLYESLPIIRKEIVRMNEHISTTK
ncbi:MAG: response regulator, partial [Bacteroidia bacterium]|nr:response regulator [Bacteroidia bacterium]